MFSTRTFRRTAQAVKMVRNCSTTTTTSSTLFRRENVPTFGFAIGVVALGVQLFLLYPWHHILSEQFNELQEKVLRMEKDAEHVNKKLDDVMKLEVEVKTKERIILDASEKILLSQSMTQEKVDSLITMAMDKKKKESQ